MELIIRQTKHKVVLKYYKSTLPIKEIKITFLFECICCDLKIGDKYVDFCSFIYFLIKIKTNLNLVFLAQNNPFMIIIVGEVKKWRKKFEKSWYFNGIRSVKRSNVDFLTSTFGLHQITNESIHVMKTLTSCVDLTFTTQRNLVVESSAYLPFLDNDIIK